MTDMPEDKDLRPRVVSMEHNLTTIGQRVTELEKKQQASEIFDATMRVKFDAVDEKLKIIGSNTTWLLRLLIGGLIMAVIGFLVRGGFHVS